MRQINTAYAAAYGILLLIGVLFLLHPEPIISVSIIVLLVPYLILILLAFTVPPAVSFLAGLSSFRSVGASLVLGLPLVLLATFVFTPVKSGNKFADMQIPWATAVGLDSPYTSFDAFGLAFGFQLLFYVSGLMVGLIVRRWKNRGVAAKMFGGLTHASQDKPVSLSTEGVKLALMRAELELRAGSKIAALCPMCGKVLSAETKVPAFATVISCPCNACHKEVSSNGFH